MIEQLSWDSNHFGLRVGRMNLANQADLEAFEIAPKSDFHLIYLYCSPAFSQAHAAWFKDKALSLMDRKQILAMKMSDFQGNANEVGLKEISEMSPKLLDLAFQSGIYSRFKIDTRFSPEIFELLYKTWVARSVSREIASHVFGYFEEENLLGFITYGPKNGAGDIGLLAVDDGQRGKGIGRKLVDRVISQTQADGFEQLTVATQGLNQNAIRFYQSCGFQVAEETDFYHYWVEA
jgi:dTDP-4-amino-4,6-dideoxy-D-galactose acyltransferase